MPSHYKLDRRTRKTKRVFSCFRVIGCLVTIGLALLTTNLTRAGDFPEHWHLVYYAARVAGYSLDDAWLIADASWAADQNDDTLATGHWAESLNWLERISSNKELMTLPENDAALSDVLFSDNARTLIQGALLHSLISNTTCGGKQTEPQPDFSARSAVRTLYRKYVHEIGDASNQRPDEGTRRLRLILMGMFLHSVVDSHVHPEWAIPGHAPTHQTDYVPNNVHGFAKAGADVYRILVEEQQFLVPLEVGSPTGTGVADRAELIRTYGLDNALDTVTCDGKPDSAYCFFREVVEAIARGYQPYKPGNVDPPKANNVGPFLDDWWIRSVSPYVSDNLLGPQRRDSEESLKFVVYGIGIKSGVMTAQLPSRTLPLPLRYWEKPSFIRYIQHNRNDGLDNLRDAVRNELTCQLRELLSLVRKGSPSYLHHTPHRLAEQFTGSTIAKLNVIVGGSASSAEKIVNSTWAPQPSSVPSLNRTGINLEDLTRRIILEVQQREWATDGLEKYLKPNATSPQNKETRIRVNPDNPAAADAELRDSLNEALKEPAPVSIVIEAPRQTADSSKQSRAVANLVDMAANEHSKRHPDGDRLLYLEGAAAENIPLIQSLNPTKTVGIPPFQKTIAVSPLQILPIKLPAAVSVIMVRDNLFMNFDPGSPGYQRLNQRAKQLANERDVMIVASSEAAPLQNTRASRIEYFAKGTSEPVTLTNSNLSNIVASVPAGSDSRRVLSQVVQGEGQHKPSNVGGISLVTPAAFPLDRRLVEAATYDAGSGRIILRMMNGVEWRLPATDPELTRNAFECVYGQNLAPELSIGSAPDESATNRGRPGYARVYFVSAIENTRLGKIMFDADQFLSLLAFGTSEDLARVGASQVGIHSLPELFPSGYAADGWGGRVYLLPTNVMLVQAGPNELAFGETDFEVRFDPSGPAQDEFSRTIFEKWDELLKSEAAGPFRDLSAAARIVCVFNWLKDAGVVFDDTQLKDVKTGSYFTPSDVPRLTLPPLDSLNRQAPFNIYGPNGLERIFDSEGKETRILYSGGQVKRVQRKDGVTLDVHYDDLGNPAAIAIGESEIGAAFYADSASKNVHFADQVKLRFNNEKYAGFESGSQSRALYQVDRTAMVATIVQNFIAEAHQPTPSPSWLPRRELIIVVTVVLAISLLVLLIYRRRRSSQVA